MQSKDTVLNAENNLRSYINGVKQQQDDRITTIENNQTRQNEQMGGLFNL